MNDLEERKEKIDKSFYEYRKSGLGLMTTIIGLSSGAFIGLFKNETTRDLSFFYLIPIALALMQQLTYYLGNQKKAISSFHWFISSHTNNADKGMDAYVDAKINLKKAQLLYDISDKFCLYSCLSDRIGYFLSFNAVYVGTCRDNYIYYFSDLFDLLVC